MAMNLEAVLKIAAKVTGMDDLGRLEKGLIGAEKAAGAAKGGFKAMIDSSAWQGAAVAAAGIGVALGFSVKAAIDFEESMAEVRKVSADWRAQRHFRKSSKKSLVCPVKFQSRQKALPRCMQQRARLASPGKSSGLLRLMYRRSQLLLT